MNIYEYNYLTPPPPPKQISKSNIKKPKGIKRTGEKFGIKNFPQNLLKLPLTGNTHDVST
jgi:hypothetical protein